MHQGRTLMSRAAIKPNQTKSNRIKVVMILNQTARCGGSLEMRN
jgi:hypothetical protein